MAKDVKVEVEHLNHSLGWDRLVYVIKKIGSTPSVRCCAPEGTKTEAKLILLEEAAGIYYFKFYFGNVGKYVFTYFENEQPKLVEIITVKK